MLIRTGSLLTFQKLWRVSWYQSLKLDAKNPVTVILKVSLKLGVCIASNSDHSDALMWILNDVMRRTHFPHLCRVESVTFLLIWEYSKWQLSCYCSWDSDGCSSNCALFPLGISLKISYKIDAPAAWTIGTMASLSLCFSVWAHLLQRMFCPLCSTMALLLFS